MAGAGKANDLFGHPRGLTVLAATEMWERFSFFGMQALLMLYMTKYLMLPENARNVLGLAAFRRGMEAVVGPLTDLAFAAQTHGLYSGLIYGTPLIGAWLGDRVLGRTRTVSIGCILMALGHLAMASTHFFLVALVLLVLGAGCVIGNMAAQVGQLYDADDTRRTRAFGVYLITLNIGFLASPLIVGTLGEQVSWHYGFGAAGIGMLIGLVIYLTGRRHLPPDTINRREKRAKLTPAERRKVLGIFGMFVPYTLYGIGAVLPYGIMYVWADKAVDRVVLGWEVPVTWIGTADGLLTILGTATAARIWAWRAARGTEPHDFSKLTHGYLLMTLAWLIAAAIAQLALVPVLLWLLFFVFLDFAFGWVEPPLQSTVSRDAPPAVNATMMATMKATGMVSYIFGGWLCRFYEPLGASLFWLLVAGVCAVALGITIVTRQRVLALLEPEHAEPAAV